MVRSIISWFNYRASPLGEGGGGTAAFVDQVDPFGKIKKRSIYSAVRCYQLKQSTHRVINERLVIGLNKTRCEWSSVSIKLCGVERRWSRWFLDKLKPYNQRSVVSRSESSISEFLCSRLMVSLYVLYLLSLLLANWFLLCALYVACCNQQQLCATENDLFRNDNGVPPDLILKCLISFNNS